MSFFKTTIAILIILILLAAGANFYYPQRISGALSVLSGQALPNAGETKCSETVPVFCATPAPAQKTSSLLELAATACRVFGTFKVGDFANIEQLLPEFSADYKTKMANWIAGQKNVVFDLDFDNIITAPLEGKTVFSDEKNGQIIILTERTKFKNTIKTESANENCLVDFGKNDADWKIENIIFSKIE